MFCIRGESSTIQGISFMGALASWTINLADANGWNPGKVAFWIALIEENNDQRWSNDLPVHESQSLSVWIILWSIDGLNI